MRHSHQDKQQYINASFTMIYCNNKPEEECKYTRSNEIWTNILPKYHELSRVYIVLYSE